MRSIDTEISRTQMRRAPADNRQTIEECEIMDRLVYTDSELAELLQVSRPTIRRMWWRKELPPPIKVGVVNRWRAADIKEWLAERKVSELYDAPEAAERKLV